jgi:hypothetical protein
MFAVSDVSSPLIVDHVNIIYLQDFHETTPLPTVNTYSLVDFISSASEIQFESLYTLQVLVDTW